VLTVVAAHAGLGPLHGGFVGVDVFFVISGYLITQQLVTEADRTGHVSLWSFYARRARRILPAATLVLVSTVVLSAWRLGFIRTAAIVRDAVWSAGFGANLHFARVGTDYFAQDLPPSPLQHYWSLSVEEQFYLVWPLLVMLCLLVWRRAHAGRSTASVPHRSLLGLVTVICVLSLWWSVSSTATDPAAAYFSTFARAWELGLGAFGAVLVAALAGRAWNRWLAQAMGLAGLVMIGWACLTYDASTPMPGTAALVPVLGSLLVILAGAVAPGPTVAGRALAAPPLRRVGDWSYSIYLWHFPLLVIPAVRIGHDLDTGRRLLVVVATLVLSALTYRFVEEPFRHHRAWRVRWRAVALYPVSLALVVVAAVSANAYAQHVAHTGGSHPAITLPPNWQRHPAGVDRDVDLLRTSVRAARRELPIPSSLRPSLTDLTGDEADVGACDYRSGTHRLCLRGDPDGDRTMVVLGNSHARHWIPALDAIARRDHFKAYYLVMPQCVAAMVTPDQRAFTTPDTQCADFHTWMVQQVQRLRPDLTIISTQVSPRGVWDADGVHHSDRATVDRLEYQGYVDLLHAVMPSSGRTVWIRDIPQITLDPGTCLSTHRTLRPCLAPEAASSTVPTDADPMMRAARAAGAQTVDMSDYFCWQHRCPTVVGGLISYRDNGHMTTAYAAHLTGPLARELGLG